MCWEDGYKAQSIGATQHFLWDQEEVLYSGEGCGVVWCQWILYRSGVQWTGLVLGWQCTCKKPPLDPAIGPVMILGPPKVQPQAVLHHSEQGNEA